MKRPVEYILNFDSPVIALTGVNILVLAVGAWAAWVLNDPHSLARSGAAAAGVSGMFVVWQVAVELRETATPEAAPPGDLSTRPVLERQAERLRQTRIRVRRKRLEDSRLKLVLAIAFWVTTGELLHGFGDMVAVRFGIASNTHVSNYSPGDKAPTGHPDHPEKLAD